MRRWPCILIFVLTSGAFAQPAEVSRVLRTFDFEERRLGNVEDLPMNWTKAEGSGLPHYVNGHLATDQPRNGKYSFRFDLNGGSLVYRYDPGKIKVQSGAHYRVEGYVRTTPLLNARARISAHLVDIDGRPIAGTTKNSELYAARAEGEDWQRLWVELSADSPKAAYLVLELALLQPQFYAAQSLGKRTLHAQDIRGSAWFDDITVSQVPRVKISTERPGNIFRRGDPLRFQVLVSDRFTDDLAAQIHVHDALGKKVYQRSGALDIAAGESLGPGRRRLWVVLPELSPGWYEVALVMSSRGQYVGEQRLALIQLADAGGAIAPDDRFGVIATDLPFEGWSELPSILPFLGAGRVKLAVWNSTGDIERIDSTSFDQMLVRLQELRITPTACLIDLPPQIAQKFAAQQRAAEAAGLFARQPAAASADSGWPHLLKANKEDWQPQLAELIARHANHLDRWQLGADGTDAFVSVQGMREVYARVYAEFANLIHKPDLAMPWPAWYELDGQLPATVALSVPPSVLPHQLPLYMADLREQGSAPAPETAANRRPATGPQATTRHAPEAAARRVPPNLSLSLQQLDRQQYGREIQIRDFAQRVIYSLAADAQRIDVPLPFAVQQHGADLEKQPQEMLMIVRTLMATLSGATFKGKVPIAEGVEAFLFDRHGQGVLVLWDRGADAGVKQLAVNLGQRPLRVDLWGNVTPLLASDDAKSAGTTQLVLGPMPVMLVDIDAQVAQLRASVAIDRPLIESSFQAHTRRLRFTNPYRTAISGTVKLKAPAGWTINPPTHSFSLNPGEVFDRELSIEFPYNSFGGAKTVEAQFAVQAERSSTFSVPITLNLGLSDVGMQTLALRDGNDIIVQQVIQNYGDKPIDYTAFAIFPGQARQERLVINLGAGRTTIKRYRFPDAKMRPGTKVRSGVKELNGPRILNDECEVQ